MNNVFSEYLSGTGTASTGPEELSVFMTKLFGLNSAEARISEELTSDPDSIENLFYCLTLLDISTHTLAWISALLSASRVIINDEELLSSGSGYVSVFVSRMRDLTQKGVVSHIRTAFHHCTYFHCIVNN